MIITKENIESVLNSKNLKYHSVKYDDKNRIIVNSFL